MGEARRRRALAPAGAPASAMITDIEDVAKIFALEQVYCDHCAEAFPLWPPEKLNEHLHAKHPGRFWPAMSQEWEAYRNDPDLARRQNYLNAYRVQFVFLTLQQRFDLYEKLVAAGVIVAPAQG